LQQVELTVLSTDVGMNVCLSSNFLQIATVLLLQFFSDSHETWHTWSVCLCANVQKTDEISKVLLYKFLANFSNFTLGFSLWNSLNNSVSQN